MCTLTESQQQLFSELSHCSSISKRRLAIEKLYDLSDEAHFEAVCILFDSPYKDLWEATLESCTPERISSDNWQKALSKALSDIQSQSAHVRQCLTICIRRMESPLPAPYMDFLQKSLDDSDADVQYQAFCTLELCEETSECYLEHVKHWINSNDVDFRIIAVQSIQRLKPEWGAKVLTERAAKALNEEAFHILLARLDLCKDDSERQTLESQLVASLSDDRFCFPAIEAVKKYQVESAIPSLVKIAKQFFGEPTIKIAAAGTAAALGSKEGRKLLVKYATSSSGNPDYADELLKALKNKDETE